MKEIKDFELPPFDPPFSFRCECPYCSGLAKSAIQQVHWVTLEHIRIEVECLSCGTDYALLILNLEGSMVIDFDYSGDEL